MQSRSVRGQVGAGVRRYADMMKRNAVVGLRQRAHHGIIQALARAYLETFLYLQAGTAPYSRLRDGGIVSTPVSDRLIE